MSDEGITRVGDRFLDGTFRRDFGLLGGSSTLRRFLGQIEIAINEPSETGVAAALDGLFHAFSELASDPSNAAGRDQVRRSADRLIRLLQQLDGQLRQTRQDAIAQMQTDVTELNAVTERIATLNGEIRTATARGEVPADLLDQRDILLDRLSGFVDVSVTHNEDGTVSVVAGNAVLVERSSAKTLVVAPQPNGSYGVRTTSGDELIELEAGSLAALSELVSTTIPQFLDELDMLAKTVVIEINAIHRTGYGASGQTNVDFFDPDGLTAGTIALSDAVSESTNAIAAGATTGPGDNSIALEISALSHTGIEALDGKTIRDFYTEFATKVGNVVLESMQDEAAHQVLTDHADAMRLSVSGVSVDEEMVNLINQQHAYSVAAHLVKVADEMIKEVLRLV